MSTTKQSSRLRHLLALAAVAGLIAAGCGNSSNTSTPSTTAGSGDKVEIAGVPGVTGDVIKYSAIGTNSNNPLGTCVLDCYVQGIKSYFDWRNSEGGVDGRKLELSTVLDDELSKNQEKALEVISANDTFGTFSATQVVEWLGRPGQRGHPHLRVGHRHGGDVGPPRDLRQNAPVCGTCTSRQSAFIAREAGAKKIATLGYGVSENSKDCANATAKSIKNYCGRHRRRRGRVHQRRPGLRPAQRHRARGHGHEGRRGRLVIDLHRPQRHEDASPRSSSARAWTTSSSTTPTPTTRTSWPRPATSSRATTSAWGSVPFEADDAGSELAPVPGVDEQERLPRDRVRHGRLDQRRHGLRRA